MLAICVLIGKIIAEPVVDDKEGRWNSWMLLETERPFRNFDGTLSNDVFRVYLWRGIAEECMAACTKDTWVAVKGRLQSENTDSGETMKIIAEKVSYLRN